MMTRTQLRVRVSLLSAQSKDGPSKLGQSDVPVTGDRSEGRGGTTTGQWLLYS